ncbi:hypothetical protein BDW59DRAFT_163143 [Aspergillus cavernicola]|uniref:WAP domain-containing protein n=1 Tax=Aspergillus cavernicola TaxID=176166 RepID=A0ABR4I740_9EURO
MTWQHIGLKISKSDTEGNRPPIQGFQCPQPLHGRLHISLPDSYSSFTSPRIDTYIGKICREMSPLIGGVIGIQFLKYEARGDQLSIRGDHYFFHRNTKEENKPSKVLCPVWIHEEQAKSTQPQANSPAATGVFEGLRREKGYKRHGIRSVSGVPWLFYYYPLSLQFSPWKQYTSHSNAVIMRFSLNLLLLPSLLVGALGSQSAQPLQEFSITEAGDADNFDLSTLRADAAQVCSPEYPYACSLNDLCCRSNRCCGRECCGPDADFCRDGLCYRYT